MHIDKADFLNYKFDVSCTLFIIYIYLSFLYPFEARRTQFHQTYSSSPLNDYEIFLTPKITFETNLLVFRQIGLRITRKRTGWIVTRFKAPWKKKLVGRFEAKTGQVGGRRQWLYRFTTVTSVLITCQRGRTSVDVLRLALPEDNARLAPG